MLVLSLFPGIGLLDMAFEELGFSVVRGPDLLWGGDIVNFHPPAGRFDGVIGGPPCKWWSSASNIAKARGQTVQPDMIPAFERCVSAAGPAWFLMENVIRAPLPKVAGYKIDAHKLDANAFGADQRRMRRFSFGSRSGVKMYPVPEALTHEPRHGTITTRCQEWDALRQRPRSTASAKKWPDAVAAQGLPADFLADAPFTMAGKWEVLGNGVPLPMGRAVARAVAKAIGHPVEDAA